jgi:O-antigen/teichoic acid export membrane protein
MWLKKPASSSSLFSRNVLTLITGTTLAQVITILFTPLITRLYGPEAFGLLAIFTSITGILGVIMCLRYEMAIMLPKSDEEAANVFGLCIFIILAISLLSVPILILSPTFLEHLLNAPLLGPFLWLVPPMIFLSGLFLALNYWNTRTKQFHRLAIAQVMRSGSSTGTQIGMGVVGYASGGMLIGASIIGQLVSTTVLGFQIMRDHLTYFRQHITVKGMKEVFSRYSNFPKYDMGSAVLNTLSGTLPVFILSIYFSTTILGYYSLGLMVLQLPLFLIGNAIGQVFFQRAAESKNISQEKLSETVASILKPLLFLSFFPMVVLLLIGPALFGIVFGGAWTEAGNYARYLSVWMFVNFIASPISSLLSVFQKQKFGLILNIVTILLRAIGLMIGALMGDAVLAIMLFSAVGVVTNGLPLLYLLRLSDVPLSKPAGILVKYGILSIPFIVVILVIQQIPWINTAGVVVVTAVLSLLFYGVAIKTDPELMLLAKNVTSHIPMVNRFFS